MIDRVVMWRALERTMLKVHNPYDLGRLGSEIAYEIGVKYLRLNGLVIEEPSKRGPDLRTVDGRVAIQARFQWCTPSGILERVTQTKLLGLVRNVKQDFCKDSRIRKGYSVLTFLDADWSLRTI